MNIFLFASTVLIWGSTWIAIALQLGEVPVLTSIFYRFALAAIILLPGLVILKRLTPVRPRDHLFIALQGLFLFSLNFVCFYNATGRIPSGLVSVIFSLATLYNAVNARLIYGDRITARTVAATAVGVCGVGLLFSREILAGSFDARALSGIGLAALGTLSFSLGNMVSRRNSAAGIPPVTANAWGMTYGSLYLLVLLGVTGTPLVAPPNWVYAGALFYLSVFGSVIGFTTYLMLVARVGSGRAAYTTVLFPVVALILSAAYEGYHWYWGTFAGVALTILGNVILFTGGSAKPAAPAPTGTLAGRSA